MLKVDKYGRVFMMSRYMDLNGNPVKKTKEDYPYSYDSFVVWKEDYQKDKSHVVYSDRLLQWDYNKFGDCCMEIWGNTGQYFYNRNPKEIETFLSKYLNKEIKLTAIMEGCNVSSGFPIWTFFYEEIED
ncbi:hypothetical protein CVD28_24895 [Bacillus sp. M6-12]|uniref:hypothetical protein n=1 Tax=Bacillus sp. M6-12 TaxID=2054166 RepID=UPI000C78DB0E|nr:hypothetical protein [Bacillus sp. M6-12]PLS15076.1 hypothetical protein CVD28_24895 [Bacillus sp. M6-12]